MIERERAALSVPSSSPTTLLSLPAVGLPVPALPAHVAHPSYPFHILPRSPRSAHPVIIASRPPWVLFVVGPRYASPQAPSRHAR